MTMFDPEKGPNIRKTINDSIARVYDLVLLDSSLSGGETTELVVLPGSSKFFGVSDCLARRDIRDYTGSQTLLGILLTEDGTAIQLCLEEFDDTDRVSVGLFGYEEVPKSKHDIRIACSDSGVTVDNQTDKPIVWVSGENRETVVGITGGLPAELLGMPLL